MNKYRLGVPPRYRLDGSSEKAEDENEEGEKADSKEARAYAAFLPAIALVRACMRGLVQMPSTGPLLPRTHRPTNTTRPPPPPQILRVAAAPPAALTDTDTKPSSSSSSSSSKASFLAAPSAAGAWEDELEGEATEADEEAWPMAKAQYLRRALHEICR